jgi:hypothetical protein
MSYFEMSDLQPYEDYGPDVALIMQALPPELSAPQAVLVLLATALALGEERIKDWDEVEALVRAKKLVVDDDLIYDTEIGMQG